MTEAVRGRRDALRRAARAERAAALVLADRRCDPHDAVPLLLSGWEHLRAATAAADPSSEEGRLRGDPPHTRRELRRARAALARGVRRAGGATEPLVLRLARPLVALAAVGVVAFLAVSVGQVLAARAERGWRAAYYPELEFEGEPVVRRDLQVRFHWRGSPPHPAGPEDRWSARWDTCLDLAADQRLELRLGSDDGSRVFVDGEEVVDNWGDHGFRWNTRSVDLEAGVHHLVVEYYDKAGKASVELVLDRPGLPEEPVPLSWLRVPSRPHDADDVCAE